VEAVDGEATVLVDGKVPEIDPGYRHFP